MKVEASSLLRIDFDAAIDKLAGSQLQGTWQLPAELARLAISSGAHSIAFDIEPRHLSMTAPGARWDRRTIADFASVLDRRLEASDRHRAMIDLEEHGAFVLSAIASSNLRSVTLTLGAEQEMRLALTAAGDLVVDMPSAGGAGSSSDDPDRSLRDVRLTVEGLAIDAERAAVWLRRAGRFSPVPISIDGTRIPHGFRAPLIEQRLEVCSKVGPTPPSSPAPVLRTALAIAARGSTPRLWLLRHGIIATHATVPGFPAFEAAIEMAPIDSTEAAALRERLGPYLESLVDASIGLMIELGKRAAPTADTPSTALPEPVRARIGRLLLRSALKRRRLSEISGVRLFPLLDEQGTRLVSIDVVSRLVRVEEGGDCALDAVPPGEDPKRYAVTGRGALAISQGERALLGELLSVVFSQPPARARQDLKSRLRDLAVRHLPRLRIARGTPIDRSELSAAECTLLDELTAEGVLPGATSTRQRAGAAFCTGHGKVQHDSEGQLLLPRDNVTVRACVDAVARDPAWLYPATVALLAGREQPGPEARRRWYAKLDRP